MERYQRDKADILLRLRFIVMMSGHWKKDARVMRVESLHVHMFGIC
jgi:hypothetical protein